MARGERALIDWLRQQQRPNPLRSPIPIGDDMAALRLAGNLVLVSADMLMDGVDFRSSDHSPEQIGRKSLACGLSDCAAMAVRPMGAIVSLALPDTWTMEHAQRLYVGFEALSQKYDCPLIGGDTNAWNSPLVIDVTVIAQPFPGVAPVRRTGGRPGDGLYVSGPLGGSIAGRHLNFEPRVLEARRLAESLRADLHAMLDISDGLSLDLWRMCEASNVGAELDEAALLRAAVHPDALAASQNDGRTPLDHALSDGEDFELLAACARNDDAFEAPPGRWLRIGRLVESGLTMLRADGRRDRLEPRGWEHWK